MLFRYAVKSLRRYAFMNLLTVLQLTAALTMTAFMVSSVSLRLSRYTPFEQEFKDSGRLAIFGQFAHDGDLSGSFKMINTSGEMSAYLGTEVTVLGTHLCGAETDSNLTVRSADRGLIDRYEPALSEGKWFSDSGLCAAVTEGCGYSAGDTVHLIYYTADGSEKQLAATVTAVVKKDEKFPGLSGDNDGQQKDTFELFYGSDDDNDSSKGIVLLDESALPDDLSRAYIGSVLISYQGGADESDITERLYQSGCVYSVSMSEVNQNSRRYLAERIYELLPLIVILCIMSFVGSISTAALSTRQQLKDYAVFILCGLKKRSCALIGLIQSIFTLAAAGVLSALSAAVIGQIYPDRFYLRADLLLTAGEAVIVVLFVAVSAAVPALITVRSEVRDILKFE